MKKKTTTKAVIYARFSPRRQTKKKQKDGIEAIIKCESIETQTSYCRKHCKFHKLEVVGEFSDKGLTGANDNRPGLREAVGLACAERAMLVAYSLSRLARSTRDAIRISEDLRDAHADLCFVTEQIDTTTAHGKLFFVIMAAMAEFDRETTSERTSAAMRYHQANGRRMSAILPFGWQADPEDPSRMLPQEDELVAIQQMKNCRDAEYSLRETADCLNGYKMFPRPTRKKFKGKMRTARGKWYAQTIRRILMRVDSETA